MTETRSFAAEMGCERDAAEKFREGRNSDLRKLRELHGGDRNDPVEVDRVAAEKFGPTHPATEDDGCTGCGAFSHRSGDCPDSEREGRR